MNDLSKIIFLDNTLLKWGISILIILGALLIIKIFKGILIKRLKKWAQKTQTKWDDFLIERIEKSVIPLLYISSFYFALMNLNLNEKVLKVLYVAYLFSCTYFILKIITAAFKKFVYSFIQTKENSESKEKQAGGLIAIANIIIWICGFIFLIDNLGYNVTTLIAGLGVGGIAIALAAQAVLGDLFSYFVIFFDRPFEIGDFVTVGPDSGIIEYIGIKTTRIQTLSGEQLVCSNTDLTNSRLRNYKHMTKRRIVFNLGVTYDTSQEKIAKIPEIVKQIILSKSELIFDRGHFSGFGDFSLNFEFVYYVNSSEYNLYMDNQQAIYLDIFAAFENEKIDFAFPTQTLYVNKVENDQQPHLNESTQN